MGAAGMEVAYRSHSRVNGWTWPLHPFQFIAWLFLLYFGLIYFLVIVPAVLIMWQPVAYASVGFLFLIQIVAHLICVSINPADPAVLAKMEGVTGKVQVPTLDRSKHKHAIEDQHCYLCEVDVGATSKHCSACNKCIANFDHHCKWLNNCVGRRNYKLFLSTLVSALLGCLIILLLSILLFTAYYTDKNSGNFLKPYKDFHNQYSSTPNANSSGHIQGVTTLSPLITSANPIQNSSVVFTVFHVSVVGEVWLFLVGFTVLLALVAIGLLGHLYGFHVYLMCKGMTTYDYIVMQREKEEKAAREREWREKDGSDSRCRNTKANQVAPQTKLESARSLGQNSGGILSEHERVLSESARHHGEEDMAPAPTPPPPMVHLTPRKKQSKRRKERERDQYRSRSDHDLECQESKRKKRKKKMQSPSEGLIFTTHSSGETINLMNGRPNGRVNGHISYMENGQSSAPKTLPPLSHTNQNHSSHHGVPAFSSSSSSLADDYDDTQDLQEAIMQAQMLQAQEDGGAPAGGGPAHATINTYPPAPDSTVGFSDIDCLQCPSELDDTTILHQREKKSKKSPSDRPQRPQGVDTLKLPPDTDDESCVPGTYNPVTTGHFEVSTSPRLILPIPPPPVLPSGPAREYHSDSAESLQEVPLSSGRSLVSGSPRLLPLNSNRSDKSSDRRRGVNKRSPSTEEAEFLQGSVRLSSLRGLPVTHIGPASARNDLHNNIPPLDLSNLNPESDEELRKPSGRLKKKSRHKQQVSKI